MLDGWWLMVCPAQPRKRSASSWVACMIVHYTGSQIQYVMGHTFGTPTWPKTEGKGGDKLIWFWTLLNSLLNAMIIPSWDVYFSGLTLVNYPFVGHAMIQLFWAPPKKHTINIYQDVLLNNPPVIAVILPGFPGSWEGLAGLGGGDGNGGMSARCAAQNDGWTFTIRETHVYSCIHMYSPRNGRNTNEQCLVIFRYLAQVFHGT